MPVLKTLLFVTAFSCSLLAHADFNGHFQGDFNTNGSDGAKTTKKGFSLTITQTSTDLIFADATGYSLLDGQDFQISGEELHLHGLLIGNLSQNTIQFTLLNQMDGLVYEATIILNQDGTLDFLDHYSDYYGDYLDSDSVMLPATATTALTRKARGEVLNAEFRKLGLLKR